MHTIEQLNQVGIHILTNERVPVYRGSFFPKVHTLVVSEFGYLLAEGEQFHLDSDFLLTVLGKAGMPTISLEKLRLIVLNCVTPIKQHAS